MLDMLSEKSSITAAAQESPPLHRTWEKRLELLQTCGNDPNGYAVLQPKLLYLDAPDGFMAGRRAWGRFLALNDPVALSSAYADTLQSVVAKHDEAVFVNLSEEAATALHRLGLGYRFHPFGAERWIPLQEPFDLPKSMAGALKKARKAGFHIRQFSPERVSDDTWGTLATINQEFLDGTPMRREITFICRPVEFISHPGVRFFSLHEGKQQSELFGFVVADPWYAHGRLIGYQLNAIRFRRTRLWGVYFVVAHHLMDLFRQEGLQRFSLGGVAFHCIDQPSNVPHDERMRKRLEFVRRHGDRYYQLSHFSTLKLQLPGLDIRRFMAIPATGSVTRSILRYLQVSEMF